MRRTELRRRACPRIRRAPLHERDRKQVCRVLVYTRAVGRCEGCGTPLRFDDMEASHRKHRSQGGAWCPSNLCALCRACHQYGRDAPHAHPEAARERGLYVRGWENPAQVPVMLWTGRRVLLGTDGSYREAA